MGFFISIEGIEGAGKTSCWLALKDLFEARGLEAVFVREPGGTEVGEHVRDILLSPQMDVRPEAELFLYAASRAQLVSEVIKPALDSGRWVVSDRYVDATVAYQGYGRGLDMDFVKNVAYASCLGVVPHLTVILDVPVEKGLSRIRDRALDRMEMSGEEFLNRVREGYLEIASACSDRCVVVNAQGSFEEVFSRVREIIAHRLGVDLGRS